MASTTIESPMSDHAESSTAAAILRNDDALSQALRRGTTLNIEDIIRLDHTTLPVHDTISSSASSSTVVFSTHEKSITTKPTSNGTDQATYIGKGKGRVKSGYSSSLSGAHGSASEAEVEQRTLRRDNLIGLGDWAYTQPDSTRTLKGSVRARERQQPRRKIKNKKPIVVIEQESRPVPRLHQTAESAVYDTSTRRSQSKRYLRHRSLKHDEDPIRLAEEGQSESNIVPVTHKKPLSRTRIIALAGVAVVMVLVVAFSAFGAHSTGKTNMSHTKIIVFTATSLISCLTVLAMLVGNRAPSEALLAGLLEFSFGFALLSQLDELM